MHSPGHAIMDNANTRNETHITVMVRKSMMSKDKSGQYKPHRGGAVVIRGRQCDSSRYHLAERKLCHI